MTKCCVCNKESKSLHYVNFGYMCKNCAEMEVIKNGWNKKYE